MKDLVKNSQYYETANSKTGGNCWHYIAHLSARAHNYTHLRHEESRENSTAGLGRIFWSFCLIILRNMSMLNHIPSSRNNSLNHILEEIVWTMQNSSRQLLWQRFKMRHPVCYQDVPSLGLVTCFCLPDMTHIRTWTRYHQYKHSDKVSKLRPPEY